MSDGPDPSANAARKRVDAAPRPPLSRRRQWLFRVAVMIASPVLFLAVLEAGLRLGGYGYATTFLVGPDANGVYTSNWQFGWRFFPPAIARRPVPCFLAAKTPETVRIFVLGSSAAQGVPEPAFSFGRILEVLLRQRYPDQKFEVVNAAITASNSHVTREVVRDCAGHQPDLFVVYMGNNEVVGPYGPGSVFPYWSPNRTFVRANVWFKSTRVGQLLENITGRFRPHQDLKEWRGLEMFVGKEVAADDRRLQTVYDSFRQNLLDICGVARGAGAPLILSTVAVNLKDCPPLASQHRSDLSADELAKWTSLYRAGVDLEAKRRWSEAITEYEAAAKIDGRFAALSYRLGRCLAALERFAEARGRFSEARDLDVLRFRADSRINAIVREVAAQEQAAGVHLLDAEESLAKSDLAVDGIPGSELFYEHVHFTFDGNYLLACLVLDKIEGVLPRLANARKQDPILSREQCAERLAFVPWSEYQTAQQALEMTARPPFTNQLEHAERQAATQRNADDLGRIACTPQALRAAYETYEAALERSPDDCQLLSSLGKLAILTGQPQLAVQHLQIVRKKLPWEPMACYDLGHAMRDCGRLDEAITNYRKAVELDPTFTMAHNNLGSALDSRGDVDEAIVEYRKALELDPMCVIAHNNLGNSLRSKGRKEEAVSEYKRALEIDAKLVTTHFNLAVLLSECGRIDEAVGHYQTALEIEPRFPAAHHNLGKLLRERGQIEEAIAEYQKALALRPDFPEARTNLQEALDMRSRGPKGR
jgi:tetratricopeptide (TPR) repeat protein